MTLFQVESHRTFPRFGVKNNMANMTLYCLLGRTRCPEKDFIKLILVAGTALSLAAVVPHRSLHPTEIPHNPQACNI